MSEKVFANIFTQITTFKPSVIYFAVGCAMDENYKLDRNNNKQYPPFMNNFGKQATKCLILFDPKLETPLKIEKANSLKLVEKTDFRILRNSKTLVLAINHPFYTYSIDNPTYMQFIANILLYVMENNKKIIINDFTQEFDRFTFSKLFDMFDVKKLLNHTYFGINSSIDYFNPIKPLSDKKYNFIHNEYNLLVEIKEHYNEIFSYVLYERYNMLVNYVVPALSYFRKENDYVFKYFTDKKLELCYKYFGLTYSFPRDICEDTVKILCIEILTDIIKSIGSSLDIIDLIIVNGFKTSTVHDVLFLIKNIVKF